MVDVRRRPSVGSVVILAVYLPACAQSGAAASHVDGPAPAALDARSSRFHVFNAIGSRGTPDLELYGLERINLVYASAIWMGADMNVPPPESNVVTVAANAV